MKNGTHTMDDSFSKFIKGVVINNKEAETIIDNILWMDL